MSVSLFVIRTACTVRLIGNSQTQGFYNVTPLVIVNCHCVFGQSVFIKAADNGGHELRLQQLCIALSVGQEGNMHC